MHDKEGAKRVLGGIKFRMPRLCTIFGDSGYRGEDLQNAVACDGYKIEIITKNQKSKIKNHLRYNQNDGSSRELWPGSIKIEE